jgi:hypothetical protein
MQHFLSQHILTNTQTDTNDSASKLTSADFSSGHDKNIYLLLGYDAV